MYITDRRFAASTELAKIICGCGANSRHTVGEMASIIKKDESISSLTALNNDSDREHPRRRRRASRKKGATWSSKFCTWIATLSWMSVSVNMMDIEVSIMPTLPTLSIILFHYGFSPLISNTVTPFSFHYALYQNQKTLTVSIGEFMSNTCKTILRSARCVASLPH